jgi:hypothetical protein
MMMTTRRMTTRRRRTDSARGFFAPSCARAPPWRGPNRLLGHGVEEAQFQPGSRRCGVPSCAPG